MLVPPKELEGILLVDKPRSRSSTRSEHDGGRRSVGDEVCFRAESALGVQEIHGAFLVRRHAGQLKPATGNWFTCVAAPLEVVMPNVELRD